MILLMLFATACSRQNDEYNIDSAGEKLVVSLQRGKVNYLQCRHDDSLTSSWPLRYPVYRFLTGDVNHDGSDDIAVGVIKRTRYDSVVRKRLFLFEVRNRTVIPLWLGSSLGHPLEDFTIRILNDSTTVIRALEQEKDHGYLVAEYEWYGFGLSFRRYIQQHLSLPEAQTVLHE